MAPDIVLRPVVVPLPLLEPSPIHAPPLTFDPADFPSGTTFTFDGKQLVPVESTDPPDDTSSAHASSGYTSDPFTVEEVKGNADVFDDLRIATVTDVQPQHAPPSAPIWSLDVCPQPSVHIHTVTAEPTLWDTIAATGSGVFITPRDPPPIAITPPPSPFSVQRQVGLVDIPMVTPPPPKPPPTLAVVSNVDSFTVVGQLPEPAPPPPLASPITLLSVTFPTASVPSVPLKPSPTKVWELNATSAVDIPPAPTPAPVMPAVERVPSPVAMESVSSPVSVHVPRPVTDEPVGPPDMWSSPKPKDAVREEMFSMKTALSMSGVTEQSTVSGSGGLGKPIADPSALDCDTTPHPLFIRSPVATPIDTAPIMFPSAPDEGQTYRDGHGTGTSLGEAKEESEEEERPTRYRGRLPTGTTATTATSDDGEVVYCFARSFCCQLYASETLCVQV